MQRVITGLLTLGIVLAAASAAGAACDPGDAAAVAAVRGDAEAQCDCAAATSHPEYVRCVARVARAAAGSGQLPGGCKRAVVHCALRSTCGRAGAVTCCRRDDAGGVRCNVKPTAALCTPRPGGTACLGSSPSCCDTCDASACAPGATTTTLPPAAWCTADLDCDDGNGCSQDRCIDGVCRHECLCVGPAGGFTCCPGPAAECGAPLVWWYTCGDPVCGGHREHPGVPACGAAEAAGMPCSVEGARCDPGDDCNALLVCATTDPTQGGMCPISRRRFKDDVRYLSATELQRLRDEIVGFPLATFRYRGAPASRTRLGFIIEDVEPSLSVDAPDDMVDLYGYATMAVAAIQVQAREIEALRRELAELRRDLAERPCARAPQKKRRE